MCRISMYHVFKNPDPKAPWMFSSDIDFSDYESSFALQGHKSFLTLETVFAISRGIGSHKKPKELQGREVSIGDVVVKCTHTGAPRVYFNENGGFRDITDYVDVDMFPCSMLTAATSMVIEYNNHSLYLKTADMQSKLSDYEYEVEMQIKYWQREKYKLFLRSSKLFLNLTKSMKESHKERYMRALITRIIEIKEKTPGIDNDKALLAALDSMPEHISA